MRYLPHTDEDIGSMLQVVGAKTLEELFSSVPEDLRRGDTLELPEPLTEWELDEHMDALSGSMGAFPKTKTFLGAGRYEHFIPAAVSYLLGRSEFTTSYTPYQPEMSQGTLQAIYEYQTLVTRLLGLEVANASLWDGASALTEALLMSIRITRRKKIAISSLVHPHHRQVVRTYLEPAGLEMIELPYLKNGRTDLSALHDEKDLAGVAIQSPNFFGCIEDLRSAGELCQDDKSLLIASFTEPLAFGILKNPGSQGAHIACGEGQSLGIPLWYGGPGLGIFATKMSYIRKIPGRLVGQCTDMDGNRGFVLTLATREQHIRREKATSNICTNSSLCALSAAMYMASLGGMGMRKLARLNHDKAAYLKQKLRSAGFKIPFDSPTFNEFVVEFPSDFDAHHRKLLEKGIVAGLPLGNYYREMPNSYLLCVTETKTREDMDTLVREVTL